MEKGSRIEMCFTVTIQQVCEGTEKLYFVTDTERIKTGI